MLQRQKWFYLAVCTILLFEKVVRGYIECDDLQKSEQVIHAVGVRDDRLLLLTGNGIFDEHISAWDPYDHTITIGLSGWIQLQFPDLPTTFIYAEDGAFIRDRDEDVLVFTTWTTKHQNIRKQIFYSLERKIASKETWPHSSVLHEVRFNFVSTLSPNKSYHGLAESRTSNGLCLYKLKINRCNINCEYIREEHPIVCSDEQQPFGAKRAMVYKDHLLLFKRFNVTIFNRTTMEVIRFKSVRDFFICRLYTNILLIVALLIIILLVAFLTCYYVYVNNQNKVKQMMNFQSNIKLTPSAISNMNVSNVKIRGINIPRKSLSKIRMKPNLTQMSDSSARFTGSTTLTSNSTKSPKTYLQKNTI
ncbi:hypothetical protein RDWZM_004014 [Blomia tropicalis]|uniref:Uncharacterized protein n=1 Tax=Blomia tropicalis TaxID=40697 RepID=A0A9Q0MHB5_BLOTA|nr:hypothetical protein RDWZM_004014 [Blomia tropicalis]